MSDDAAARCCATSAMACPFAKALLARTAACERVHRRQVGEQALMACTAPVAHSNCTTLLALGGLLDTGPNIDVHRMVLAAHDRHQRFDELPWAHLVAVIAAWKPRQRRAPATPSPRSE